jgi:amino acid adenylation domain-containing protein
MTAGRSGPRPRVEPRPRADPDPRADPEPRAWLSIPEILRWRAGREPDRVGYVFLAGGEMATQALTYGELDAQASALAAALEHAGAVRRPVIVAYPAGLDFISAFFGCLYAGAVPIAVELPAGEGDSGRVGAVAAHVEPAAVLAPRSVLARIAAGLHGTGDTAFIAHEDAAAGAQGDYPITHPEREELAYLQYTSGSTTRPRGVMIGHGALLEQLERYRFRAGADWREVVMVGWLPHQHDFGLVGFVLSGVYMGVPYYFMAPASFLRRPMCWPEAIARFRGTYSGAPTFAYALCARARARARAGGGDAPDLDLSRWSIASVGAEPLVADALTRFARAFAPNGFDPSAFLTTYGLAEAVLCVTARQGVVTRGREGERNGSRLRPRVSAGSPLPGQQVLIVDPETRIECPPGEVGEIWIGGRSVASGYWRAPQETKDTFEAVLADSGAGPFLRSGDLGFLEGDELFVVDRLKDVIVVRGQNHHPHDIEATVQATDPALRLGCGAAFQDSVDGAERVVVVQELARSYAGDTADLVARARAAVAEGHGLHLWALELIEPGSIPRTSSGKLRRRAARAAWRAGALVSAAAGQPGPGPGLEPSSVARELAGIWREALDVARVKPDDDFFALGGDSLAACRVVGAVAERLGVELPVHALFEERTVARVARYLATLPRRGPACPQADAEPDADLRPLTAGQHEMVRLAAFGPDAAATFHMMAVLGVTGAPHEPALRRALGQLVRRHESLRSVLARDGLHMRVLPAAEVEVRTATVADDALVDWLRQERERRFDLERRPPWRATLIRGDTGARLVLSAHHLIADGASVRTLVAELGVGYEAARQGEAPRLFAPMQYGEYWRRRAQRVTAEATAAHERHWRAELGGELPVLELPSDLPRPRTATFVAANHTIALDAGARGGVERLAQEHGCTPFMVLLAGYSALLHRLCGQDEVLLAFASDGRHVPGSHAVIGTCSTDLPLRSCAAGDPTVSEHLAQVRAKVLGALEHQDYTLGMLLDELRAPVDVRRPLRVTTAFNLQVLPPPDGPFAVDLELQAASVTRCLLDLEVSAFDTGSEIRLDFTYNTAILDPAAVARIASYFRRLLEGMAANPSAGLHALPILPPEEERLLLEVWGMGPAGEPERTPVTDLIAASVAEHPTAIAVLDDEGTLTYAELSEQADAVAGALAQAGALRGTVTALLASRGAQFLAALLGILRAGCVLLPLDPRDPDRRLGATLAHSEAAIVIAGPGFEALAASLLDAAGEARRPSLVALADALGHTPERERRVTVAPSDPAYAIFTSGSSGAPKGAMVAHAGLANHLRAKVAALAMTDTDIVAQTAPQSFDIAIWQHLAPLLAGASVRVIADEATHDPVKLLRALDEEQVTVFETVPSMLRALLDEEVQRAAGRPRLMALRWLVPTGEALAPKLCRRWMSHYPAVPLLNAYGPAECSDDVTHHVIEWPPAADSVRVPIGRPIAGARVYVRDARGELAPMGAPGELHVGGVCVGLGYLHDPELTAQAFVPDPFAEGGTLYRTGDLVRWRADGMLDFLGRIDDQEQLQGVRVEPGEVESVLGQHPAVRACAVAVRRTSDDAKVLAGYVVLRPGNLPPAAELRHFLRTRLPHYLVPATITVLDALPVNANGKVDRKALPAPALDAGAGSRVAPRTEVERGVAAIWARALQRRDLGVHDDFFELGGRSLDAVAMAVELRRAFGVTVPVFQLYREPSLGAIARFVEDARREPAWT